MVVVVVVVVGCPALAGPAAGRLHRVQVDDNTGSEWISTLTWMFVLSLLVVVVVIVVMMVAVAAAGPAAGRRPLAARLHRRAGHAGGRQLRQ